jgi:hypothetical protein
MQARLRYEFKQYYDDGATIEMVIWEVPQAVAASEHRYKYRLYYGYPGRRVVGYDNEAGKGDHRHLEDQELPYVFVSVEALIQDFLANVKAKRGT